MLYKMEGIAINYEIIGTGRPVIMLHGYNVDHRLMLGCMEPVFNNLSNYQRIYIDLPGMGKTKGEPWIVSSDIMLDIVINFIQKIIPEENFLLAGESYGGYLARGLVNRMPDKIDGLLLLCPVIEIIHENRILPAHTVLKRDDELFSQLEPSEAKGFSEMNVVQCKETWQKYRTEILPGVKLADNDFLNKLQQSNYEFSFDVDKLDKKFSKPTLMLFGRQDSVVGYKDVWRVLDNYPRATYTVLDRAGHNLQIEQIALFNALVAEWITRVEEVL